MVLRDRDFTPEDYEALCRLDEKVGVGGMCISEPAWSAGCGLCGEAVLLMPKLSTCRPGWGSGGGR